MQRANGVPACASCKHQRKKCTDNCILAPFFPAEKHKEFQAVQKVFGVSNAAKSLKNVDTAEDRRSAAESLIWEAFAWEKDPIQGPYGEFRRILEELKYYKTQYHKIISQVPTSSQGATMVYKPPAAATATVMINGSWNNSNNNGNNGNNGGVSMINGICGGGGLNNNGGTLNCVLDYQNGNSTVDHSSNPYSYAANNHVVAQNMGQQNGSAAVVLPQAHPNNNSNNHVLQSMANLWLDRDHQNGSGAVILPPQHYPIAGFNRQYYLPAGQCNSSTDTKGKTAESSLWQAKS